LLRFLFDAHPAIACPPESKVFVGINSFLSTPQVVRGLGSIGASRSNITDALRTLVDSLMDAHAARKGKRRWIDKTPNNVPLLDLIEELYCGQAHFIFVVRHPLDCIESLVTFFQDVGNYEDPDIQNNFRQHGYGYYGWAKYWLESAEKMLIFSQSVPDRCVFVRYEDLVDRPHEEIRKLFSFLGEATPPDIVERAFDTQHDRGYQDSKILLTKGIHVTSVNKWHRWPPGHVGQIWRVVGGIAKEFGYSVVPGAPRQPAFSLGATSDKRPMF
jgi:Sulfotransferase family